MRLCPLNRFQEPIVDLMIERAVQAQGEAGDGIAIKRVGSKSIIVIVDMDERANIRQQLGGDGVCEHQAFAALLIACDT